MGLFEEYKRSLKLVDVEEVFDLVFYRPLAFLFVKSILNTNLTPNQITIGSVIFGVTGAIVIATGIENHMQVVAGGLFIMLYNIFDCSDGQLARIKKNGTEVGRIIDGIGDYVVSISVYLAIGFGYANSTSNPLYWWGLIVATGISNAFQASLVDYERNRYLDYAFDRESLLEDSLETAKISYANLLKEKGRYFDKFVYWIYVKYSMVQIKFSSSKEKIVEKKYDKSDFLKKNRLMIHLWTYLGPTTQWTLFIILATFFNRFDLYMYTLTFILNVYAIILIITQKKINKSLKIAGAK